MQSSKNQGRLDPRNEGAWYPFWADEREQQNEAPRGSLFRGNMKSCSGQTKETSERGAGPCDKDGVYVLLEDKYPWGLC